MLEEIIKPSLWPAYKQINKTDTENGKPYINTDKRSSSTI
jgi:hypothetical protein